MNKFLKYPLIFIGVVATIGIVGFAALRIYWAMNSQDEPVPDDSDLIPVITEIPDGENAYFEIIKAQDALVWPKEEIETSKIGKILKNEEWDEQFIVELLEKNKTALEHFEKAANFNKFKDPAIPSSADLVVADYATSSISDTRNLAKIELVKAMALIKEKKYQEAFDRTAMTMKIGQLFQDTESTLIHYLVGLVIKEKCTESLKSNINGLNLSPEELVRNSASLEKFKENENGLGEKFKFEYLILKNSKKENIDDKIFNGQKISDDLDLVPTKKMFQSTFLYKPNQTTGYLVDLYERHIKLSHQQCNSIDFVEHYISTFPVADLSLSSFPKMLFTENIVGKILHNTIAVSLSGVFSRKCKEDANIIEVQLMLAAKAYEQDKGKKPDKLEDLVPDYISEIPIDPFTGKLVEYSPENGVLINKEVLKKEN